MRENAASVQAPIELSRAEEDFLFFFPADIAALRAAVAEKYGATDERAYSRLFEDASRESTAILNTDLPTTDSDDPTPVDTSAHSIFL